MALRYAVPKLVPNASRFRSHLIDGAVCRGHEGLSALRRGEGLLGHR